MKRAAPLLIAILLGAIATAVGMGIFLKLANDDRAKLSDQIRTAQEEATAALREKERVANEANDKVEAANEEVAKAQRILQELEEEQELLTHAVQLSPPSTRETRYWETTVSLPLEISFLRPPGAAVESNDAQTLTLTNEHAPDGTDSRWLSIGRYDDQIEKELAGSFSTSTAVSYLVQGRLITGKVGVLPDDESLALFRVRQAASSTHLIWIKDTSLLGSGDGIERLLGTMEFGS